VRPDHCAGRCGWLRISEKRVRRLRLLITILLATAAVVSAAATLRDRLHLQLWGSLTVLLTVLAVLAPTFQGWLKQAQALLDKQDQKEEERARGLADRARRDVLEQVRRAWVEPELQGSLYEQARIELGLAERPAAVENPLRAVLRRPDEPDRLLEPGRPIADVFRELGRQLLILGEPGAGKTTLLMELTDQLLKEAERAPEQPTPVVFHLSTWGVERRPLPLWLVDELYKRYGVPRRLGQRWIDNDQVLPLLDGLDEVDAAHRDECAAAINAFHDAYGLLPLAICSRITEYEALQSKLRLRGAIVIQPLRRVDVDRYLRQAGRPLGPVRAAVRADQQLTDLLTTPLFLSIVALTYGGKAPGKSRTGETLNQRRSRVLTDYITTMLTRPQPSAASRHYAPEQIVRWLAWLASAMEAHGQSVFYIDWMQPDWLSTSVQRRLVTVGSSIAAGVGSLVIFETASVLILGPFLGLSGGVGVGLLLGVSLAVLVGLGSYDPTINPTERLRWTTQWMTADVRPSVRAWFVGAAIGVVGCLSALLGAYAVGGRDIVLNLPVILLITVIVGIPGGLMIEAFDWLTRGLQTESYVTPPAPGKAIQVSLRNALLSGIVGSLYAPLAALIVGLFVRLFFTASVALAVGLLVLVYISLGSGAIVGWSRGGGAYLRHQFLRRLLILNGSIPRHYVAFLDYTTRLILLRRRGGGYEFVHRLLLEHFAALEPHAWQRRASRDVSQDPLATSSVDQQPARRGA
jgi:hypothetical protein